MPKTETPSYDLATQKYIENALFSSYIVAPTCFSAPFKAALIASGQVFFHENYLGTGDMRVEIRRQAKPTKPDHNHQPDHNSARRG